MLVREAPTLNGMPARLRLLRVFGLPAPSVARRPQEDDEAVPGGGRLRAVLMDFGSAAPARVDVRSRAEALAAQENAEAHCRRAPAGAQGPAPACAARRAARLLGLRCPQMRKARAWQPCQCHKQGRGTMGKWGALGDLLTARMRMQTRACHRAEPHCRLRPGAGAAHLAGALPGSGCPPRAARRTGRRSCGTCRARAGWTSAWTSGAWAACSILPCTASRPSSGCAVPPAGLTSNASACPCMIWHVVSCTKTIAFRSPRRSVLQGARGALAAGLCRYVCAPWLVTQEERQQAHLRLCYQALCSKSAVGQAGQRCAERPV